MAVDFREVTGVQEILRGCLVEALQLENCRECTSLFVGITSYLSSWGRQDIQPPPPERKTGRQALGISVRSALEKRFPEQSSQWRHDSHVVGSEYRTSGESTNALVELSCRHSEGRYLR